MLARLDALKERFYCEQSGGKNTLFKKAQKEACARSVAAQVSLEEVVSQSFFAVPGRVNSFYMNYPLMKTYVNPDNHEKLTLDLVAALRAAVDAAGGGERCLEVHINLNGFTVSAAERYKYVVEFFSETCNARDVVLTPHIAQVVIYYAPAAMESILGLLRMCVQPEILQRLRLVAKEDSETALAELF